MKHDDIQKIYSGLELTPDILAEIRYTLHENDLDYVLLPDNNVCVWDNGLMEAI